MLKIRRPLGRLIFNMGIAIPGKTVFLIETAPRVHAPMQHVRRKLNKISIEISQKMCIFFTLFYTDGDTVSKVHAHGLVPLNLEIFQRE